MSTITAVGPALRLDGPLPQSPPHSLLNTPGVVVEEVDEDSRPRWLNGVNVWGYPDETPSSWEPCSTGTFRTKVGGSEFPQERFDPIVIYIPVTCSSLVGDFDGFAEKAERVLEATLSMGVERALASGVILSTNPFFGDASVSILNGGVAVSPGVGLSFLEQAIGATGRRGMIHATPAVVAALQAIPVGDSGEIGPLVTANGTPVVSGDGYQDVDTAFLATPAATQDWVFATGPVEVRLAKPVTTTVEESLDRSDNTIIFRAEQYVLAEWDGALQSAVLVDWSL